MHSNIIFYDIFIKRRCLRNSAKILNTLGTTYLGGKVSSRRHLFGLSKSDGNSSFTYSLEVGVNPKKTKQKVQLVEINILTKIENATLRHSKQEIKKVEQARKEEMESPCLKTANCNRLICIEYQDEGDSSSSE